MRESTKGTLSKKNQYYIPKYRYYELKYRCLQYDEWIKERNDISYTWSKRFENDRVDGGETKDTIMDILNRDDDLREKIRSINLALQHVPLDLREPIKYAVTKGAGWSVVQARYSLICTRDEYYNAYHKFFWTLDKLV